MAEENHYVACHLFNEEIMAHKDEYEENEASNEASEKAIDYKE